ncbi:DUF3224 domain-containing protein [Sphaerisporangium sp. NPDC049002]|uniref:DUF3224 domain-containing protein n=1 Tax=unclassified Sphaerisporangium TaxID=2630420 RepID=UPI0033F21131
MPPDVLRGGMFSRRGGSDDGEEVEGSAAYVGFERFTGGVHGRKGSFVLHHTATGSAGEQSLSWTILPDSGTGELLGIRGGGQIIPDDGEHFFHLDYELD